MMVTLLYHIGGRRVIGHGDCKYEGGELIQAEYIDPDEINLMDLMAVLHQEENHKNNFKLYYKEQAESGVNGFVLIVNDDSIRSLLHSYDGKEVYDIYVEVEDEAAAKATKSRFEEHTEDLETPHSDDDEDSE
ncbi:unnamed protein product [Linum trigynum]|uniref:PB1-like domain-containing protein n=1 Tax=Linum trigynum TaxID=586398 RepID=A0AAV2E968_9ROSI